MCKLVFVFLRYANIQCNTYTGTRLRNNRKWGTLKTLVRRAYEACSIDEYLRGELKHIRGTFDEINNYPH